MPAADQAQRTVADVDSALSIQLDSRKRHMARIEELLRTITELRGDCAYATRRIDALLEERETLAHLCPDTPAGIAETVEEQP